jgi:deoxyribodipyrimidine photo-lyase
MTTALWWVRRDLRLHDNPTLVAASQADSLLPVYIVDPREYGQRPYGGTASFEFEKTGAHRVRFRRESVADLREQLAERGSALVVREGRTEAVLADLSREIGADAVHFQTLPGTEERLVADAVRDRLRDEGATTEAHWTHTLHHRDDLPNGVTGVPDTYTSFRKSVEGESRVRDPVGVPTLPPVPAAVGEDHGVFPSLADLSLDVPPDDDRAVLDFAGGESAGLDRLHHYLWAGDHLRDYKETRNGMLGADYSSKLSPWLNEGCLSLRRVHDEVRRYERERVENDSTYWLLFELRWRDFFQFQVAKHGGRYFSRGGIRDREDVEWRDPAGDDEASAWFDRWKAGETGIPFVDANMRELNRTGFMSNRGRQNVASFLANNLRIDWRRGAAYFETQLVDYDPASNYGNWAYVAGVGNDSRDRYFNIVKQATQYDGDVAYVKQWLPALAEVPATKAHEPWALSEAEQEEHGVVLGEDYPEPMVDLEASYDHLRG